MRESHSPPAFPVDCNTNPDCDAAGMTLRDWYAGMALQGLLANGNGPVAPWIEDAGKMPVAWMAYEIAEAMLVARGGRP